MIGADVGGAAESITVTTLGELQPAAVDMRCLLIVGSSKTTTVRRGDGSVLVLTPRRYE